MHTLCRAINCNRRGRKHHRHSRCRPRGLRHALDGSVDVIGAVVPTIAQENNNGQRLLEYYSIGAATAVTSEQARARIQRLCGTGDTMACTA